MTHWVIYLLKVIAIHGALFLFYWMFLRNTLRHQLNRIFLLIGLIAAFVIPQIHLPTADNIPIVSQNDQVVVWLTQPAFDYEIVMSPIQEKASKWSLWLLIPVTYILISLIFIIRSAVALASIKKIRSHSVAIKKYWYNLFKTSHSRPFSFFSNVFIPKSLFDSEDFDQVLAHECVHVKQRHSIDRLLLDFVVSLFWFNPFIYLYRNALIEIHEYQADEAVVKRFKDPVRYQEILFSQLQTPQYSGMVSHFNFSMIKKRIVMMNKQNKSTKWIYLMIAPLTLMMIFAFSNKEAMSPIEKIGNEISAKMEPAFLFDFPEIVTQNNFRPSILPIKNSENIRMTSGFGMRMHPIDKVEKKHNGADFACEKGTHVIASADGTVVKIKTSLDGYGKMIAIDHNGQFITRYAQLSDFKVKKGDKVKRGQLIGLSGNSGASTAPHLHYEVIESENGHVDPESFIKNYEFKSKVKKSQNSTESKSKENSSLYKDEFTPSISPIKHSESVSIGSHFGKRIHPIYKAEKMHYGIDLTCKTGTEVIATANGVVEEVQNSTTGYGKKIVIQHGDQYQTLYAHLSKIEIKKGDLVKKGQLIGLSGDSGASITPHLHYEVIKVGKGKVDPKLFIKNYEFNTQKIGTKHISELKEAEIEIDPSKKREQEEKIIFNSSQLKFQMEESFDTSSLGAIQPLIVLDGRKMKDFNLNEINTSTIANIVVLKDQKAFDKYGDEGGNGVIEITSKNEKKVKRKKKNKDKEKRQAYRVIIDPGHGGKDSGELYSDDKYEKDLVLAIAKKVKEEFSNQSEIEVLLTRDHDQFVSLRDRKSIADDADLFISLHSQDYHDKFGGSVVLMYSNKNYYYDRSRQIAVVLNDEFSSLNEGERSLASFTSGKEEVAEHWLLNNLEVPAVLVQFGIEKGEKYKLNESTIASKIATGIRIAAF